MVGSIALVAVMAAMSLSAAGGVALADAHANDFVLQSSITEEEPTFGIYYKLGAAGAEAGLADAQKIDVDLKADGEFHALAKCVTSNKKAQATYKVTLTPDADGRFKTAEGAEGPEVKWFVGDAEGLEATASVARGLLADAQTLADFKAVWTGDTALDAGDYTYTASVNVTAN